MKDRYPESTIPQHFLVPPELQPDYQELPGHRIPDVGSVSEFMFDAHVRAGRGGEIAAIHAESGQAYTFGEIAGGGLRLARTLIALGLRRGDRVAFRSPNVPELLTLIAGVWKAGGVVVPTPVHAPAEELRFFLDDSGARFLFVFGRGAQTEHIAAAIEGLDPLEVLAFGPVDEDVAYPLWSDCVPPGEDVELPQVPSDGIAVLWHTGGTTGRPKACYHTHRRYVLGGLALAAALKIAPRERWAAAAPVGHGLGFLHHTSYAPLHGATAVFIEDFRHPESILRAIEQHRIDTMTAITASWAHMLEVLETGSDYDITSIRRAYGLWQSASAGDVYHRWKSRGIELLNNFGSTAFASWVLVPHAGDKSPRASLGRPTPGYDIQAMALEDDLLTPVSAGVTGRMAVKGPTGLTYWNRLDLQRRDVVDGWTLSDDLIAFDHDGNASYLGRTDYLISTAGYKVPPGEVEEIIASHPAVAEVAVIGASDPIRQEVVMAFVATHNPEQATDQLRTDLQELVKRRLAPYKYPRRVEFIPALPRDHVGKVRHRVIRQWAEDRSQVPSGIL